MDLSSRAVQTLEAADPRLLPCRPSRLPLPGNLGTQVQATQLLISRSSPRLLRTEAP